MDARTLLIIFIVVVAICLAVSILLRLTRIALVFGRSLYTGPDPLHDHVGRWN